MAKEYVVIEDDHCYVDIPVYTGRGDCCDYKRQLIMTKEVFQECYKKWILDALVQRTGHWIYDKIDMNGYYLDSYECSVCKCSRNADTHYCPNCGAKMVEPQEK